MKNKIIMFTQFPKPITGLSLVNETYFLLLKQRYPIKKLNIANIGILGFTINIFHLIKLRFINEYNILFYSPGASLIGLFRDSILVFVGKSLKMKIFVTVHRGNLGIELRSIYGRIILRYILKNTNYFIFLSTIHSKLIKEYLADNYSIIDNPSYPPRVIQSEIIKRKINNINKKKRIVFLFLSKMIESKGYKLFAEALCYLKYRSDWKALFVGKWDDHKKKTEFEEFLIENEINLDCEILGEVRNDQNFKRIMLDANVLVFPTYYPQEARPMVIIEALSYGIPVISTKHTSIPEMVDNGYNGFLVQNNSNITKEIAEYMSFFFNREKLIEFSNNARKSYDYKFSNEKIKEKLINVIEGL